jgi:hypothetical protein
MIDGVNKMTKQDIAAATAGAPDLRQPVRGGEPARNFWRHKRSPQLRRCPKFQQEAAARLRRTFVHREIEPALFLNTPPGSRWKGGRGISSHLHAKCQRERGKRMKQVRPAASTPRDRSSPFQNL